MGTLIVLAIDAVILLAIPTLYARLHRVAGWRGGYVLAVIPAGLLVLAVALIATGYTHLRIDFAL